jgi:hypothetical protein
MARAIACRRGASGRAGKAEATTDAGADAQVQHLGVLFADPERDAVGAPLDQRDEVDARALELMRLIVTNLRGTPRWLYEATASAAKPRI